MRVQLVVFPVSLLVIACGLLFPHSALADPQLPTSVMNNAGNIEVGTFFKQSSVDIYVKGPNGAQVQGQVIVTLTRVNGEVFDQETAKNGFVRFNQVPHTEFKLMIFAPAYQSMTKDIEIRDNDFAPKFTFELEPLADAEDAATAVGLYALPPKVQKDVGKALEALRANKPNGALNHLETAQRVAPKSAEVEYLFAIYSTELNDTAHAREYWMKTLELNPRHLSALLAVGQDLIEENKPADAMPYLNRAVEVEPSAWRGHALLAKACALLSMPDDATKHAQRAIELGHDRASLAQLVLVRVLLEKGEKDRAIPMLEAYVKAHPSDKESAKSLDRLKNPSSSEAAGDAGILLGNSTAAEDALPVSSNWLPPDVDASMPAVEPGASCPMEDVVKKAGQRLSELMTNVDKFTATESLTHESISKYGLPSSLEKRRFNYVVSIEEVRHGYLNVEEYRDNKGLPAEFPDGVATNGLPALVLIFHPYNVVNFEMNCEGLARTNGGLAWQVHFKQRPDKPNTIRRYRIGADGPSYPVALKGRAWISADTYQIVRLESDMVAPVPQIKLIADHTAIEYGPVKFRKGDISMWLPQSAEIYYDWRGKRIHRRHSFSNYLLFGVDDRQKISVPKVADVATDGGPSTDQKEKP